MKKSVVLMALTLAITLIAGVAYADFTPQFAMELSDTKVKANPSISFHLEFDETDEEIGLFTAYIPKGFNIASDDQIPEVSNGLQEVGEVIGSGTITIAAGPGCRPGPEGELPLQGNLPVDATFHERTRTDEEADAGVHAIWFLDIEPLNRVRLKVTGSPKKGWTVSGAPDPSDNTCNPLIVDLTINAQSESGVPIVTNSARPGKHIFRAEISSQDSPAVAKFKQVVKLTK